MASEAMTWFIDGDIPVNEHAKTEGGIIRVMCSGLNDVSNPPVTKLGARIAKFRTPYL